GLERQEAVSIADGDEQLLAVIGAEFDADPMAERRRGAADVDGDVEDAAGEAADQFRLAVRRALEMEPAQGSRRAGERLVVLAEGTADAVLGQPHPVGSLAA